MKSVKTKIALLLILAFIAGTALRAQPAMAKNRGIAGLSEDQKAQIHKLRISHLKEVQGIKNQLGENRAHYKTLMTAENPDMNAINKNIDEYTSLRNQMLKKQAAHIQDIRKLLNDEQRLAFDQKMAERSRGEGFRQGRMRGRMGAGAPDWNKGNKKMNNSSVKQE